MSETDQDFSGTPLFTYSDPETGQPRELPFAIGVLSDLSGNGALSSRPLAEREFVDVDRDSFSELLSRTCPCLAIAIDDPTSILYGDGTIVLQFRELEDFHPDRVVGQIARLAKLRDLRQGLAERIVAGDFAGAVALRGAANLRRSRYDLPDLAAAYLDEIDVQLSREVGRIFGLPEFQHLEAAWRGLRRLVDEVDDDERLRIRVLDISYRLLRRDQRRWKGRRRESELTRKIYDPAFASAEAVPFGVLVGDFEFTGHADSVDLLTDLASCAEDAHAPFIASAGPEMFRLSSFADFAGSQRDLDQVFQHPDYASWRSLRSSSIAKYVALCVPRFLLRGPYGSDENPVQGFRWHADQDRAASCLWGSSAFLLAARIAASFVRFGWSVAIQGRDGGGVVSGLLVHRHESADGEVASVGPTEYRVWDVLPHQLSRLGFVPLVGGVASDRAVFFYEVPSCHQPGEYDDAAYTRQSVMAATLPCIMAICRVIHYLRAVIHSPAAQSLDPEQLNLLLRDWFVNYEAASAGQKPCDDRRYPFSQAVARFMPPFEDDDWRLRVRIYPRYQIESLPLGLVAHLTVKRRKEA